MDPVILGLIGCGNISDAYLAGAARSGAVAVKACADLRPEVAQAKAAAHDIRAMSVDDLLADPEIELVVNLTVPDAHVPIGLAVLAAGKHHYSEKPFGTNVAEARRLVAAAAETDLRLGCAPDTFLGGAPQAVRRLIDDGAIGRPVGGTVAFMSPGMQGWHPNPDFFFQPGGGPVLDVGPYYVAALVNLFGPVRRVAAIAGRAHDSRTIGSGPRAGEAVPVAVPTHFNGALEFDNGANVSFIASWDVQRHAHNEIEIYGTEGSLIVPDPNFFGGTPRLSVRGGDWQDQPIDAHPFSAPNFTTSRGAQVANYRMIGVVDMAYAIRAGRPHRANAAFALHALEVMEGLHVSAETGRHVAVESRCDRPAPVPMGAGEEVLVG